MTSASLLRPALVRALPIAVALLLAACAGQKSANEPPPPAPPPPPPRPVLMGATPATTEAAARVQSGATESADRARIFKGSGVVVRGQQPNGALPPSTISQQTGGPGFTLNWEGVDLREVIRAILGDMLNENYTIDPAVGGQVTIRTSSPIAREALLPTLETLVRMNGATMVKEGDLYKIVPQAAAVRGNVTPQLGNSARALPAGFSVQIIPLRYVGVREMLRILEPFAKDAQAVRGDDLRNLLIISGTERELRHLIETVDMFDIDWMSGMSAGVFTLQNADVKSVMGELDKLLGNPQANPLAGIIRIIPIERMNAILVISPNPQYLEEAKKWVERLDRGGGGDGVRFFVYHLQNTRAERLAPLLQQAFTGRVTQPGPASAPTTAPGTPAGTIVNPPTFQPSNQPVVPTPTAAAPTPPGAPPPGGGGLGVVRNIQVVADKDANTILLIATPAEYAVIEAALRRLDVAARQVLVELVIAEVALTDDFQFGVEWYFTNGPRQAGGLFAKGTNPGNPFGGYTPPTGGAPVTAVGLIPKVPGFSYLLSGLFPGGIQAAVSLLGQAGNTKIVANPHIAALDNQKATIKVGNRIPICQQTIVGGTTNTVTTTSQYIDTGVLVALTPHINQGGLVTLDVQAEVSSPGTTIIPCEAPPINTRSIQSILAVQSGRTLVMGGLISDVKTQSSQGIPLLSKIPVVGGLFGQQELKDERTELVLFITPRVMDEQVEINSVIDDLRRRMERLDSLFPRDGSPYFPGGSPDKMTPSVSPN
jgi:general secretion pathway protein D